MEAKISSAPDEGRYALVGNASCLTLSHLSINSLEQILRIRILRFLRIGSSDKCERYMTFQLVRQPNDDALGNERMPADHLFQKRRA